MRQIIYASRRNPSFKYKQVIEMLDKARAKNSKHGLCGMLIYGNNQFLQILEGFKGPVAEVEDLIFADDRHTDIKVISDAKISSLSFTKWDMGYLNLDDISSLTPTPFLDMNPGDAWQCLLNLRDQLGEVS